jgi:hypothetical protein
MQDDVVWDGNEQSGEGASSSENESMSEGSVDELSDDIKKMERNMHVVEIVNFHFILDIFHCF